VYNGILKKKLQSILAQLNILIWGIGNLMLGRSMEKLSLHFIKKHYQYRQLWASIWCSKKFHF